MTQIGTVMMRNMIRELSSSMTSLCSAARLCLEDFSSVIPSGTYTLTSLLTRIAATVITGLVLAQRKGEESMPDDTRWEKIIKQTVSENGEISSISL